MIDLIWNHSSSRYNESKAPDFNCKFLYQIHKAKESRDKLGPSLISIL